jgi:hypothetical protein
MEGKIFDRVSPGILVFGGKFLQSFCLERKDFDHKSKATKSRKQGR